MAAITAHGRIFIDNSLSTYISNSSVAAIANDFENAYSSNTKHFATSSYLASNPLTAPAAACDSTGNPLTTTSPQLIAPDPLIDVEVINSQGLGSGVGGYFTFLNYIPQPIANCFYSQFGAQPMSNEAAMIFVGFGTTDSLSGELNENLVRGMAHEYQHLINFVAHAVNSPSIRFEDTWIDEGLSMLAQDFAVNQLYPSEPMDVYDALRHAFYYLNTPQNESLTAFMGVDPGKTVPARNCMICYGASYLFQRYVYDRFGGDAYSHALEQSGVSYANLQAVTGQDPRALISDFAAAMLASNTGLSSDPRFSFKAFNPYGTYADQFGASHTFRGPNAFSIAPGQSVTPATFLGSFVYYGVNSLTSAGAVGASWRRWRDTRPDGLVGSTMKNLALVLILALLCLTRAAATETARVGVQSLDSTVGSHRNQSGTYLLEKSVDGVALFAVLRRGKVVRFNARSAAGRPLRVVTASALSGYESNPGRSKVCVQTDPERCATISTNLLK